MTVLYTGSAASIWNLYCIKCFCHSYITSIVIGWNFFEISCHIHRDISQISCGMKNVKQLFGEPNYIPYEAYIYTYIIYIYITCTMYSEYSDIGFYAKYIQLATSAAKPTFECTGSICIPAVWMTWKADELAPGRCNNIFILCNFHVVISRLISGKISLMWMPTGPIGDKSTLV